MADLPLEDMDGKTPLELAKKPNIDKLCKKSELGMVKTVPDNISPGSDVANLSVIGYDPQKYYTGRSPLEAASIGVKSTLKDITFRCNLVTLSNENLYSNKTMIDYSSDEITTEESAQLIDSINEHLKNDIFCFYKGISYRHLLLWTNGMDTYSDLKKIKLTPPHDISDRVIGDFLPNDKVILEMMEESYWFLKKHPINLDRIARGLRPANSIWIWGEGVKPNLPLFSDKYHLKGSVISAVDLIKGIGKSTGLNVVEVEGATGNIHTSFEGKAAAAINALKSGDDFVYLHMEAPDECGHRGERDNKIKSIELIDEKVIAAVVDALVGEEFKLMFLPDHPTPLTTRTHSSDPVPFMIYDSRKPLNNPEYIYSEKCAQSTGLFIEPGFSLMSYFLSDK